MKKITLLFPGSYMDYRKIDEDMQEEYRAAVETGLYHTILFNYDEWVAGGSLRMTEKEASSETYCAVYRGWMLKPEDYLRLFEELSDKGIRLLTTPREYDNLHLFPNVYPFIKKDTAGIIYFADGKVDVDAVKKKFRRFMVKDSVKSVKGTEFPAFFGQDITQAEFNDWMQVFYKYRGDLMTGGICIKEYLDLKRYASRTNEFRAFYADHKVISICRNSLQPDYTEMPPADLIERYSGLSSPYYTIDYAELADGTWKILEAGDGSVSGLSPRQEPNVYYKALYNALSGLVFDTENTAQ